MDFRLRDLSRLFRGRSKDAVSAEAEQTEQAPLPHPQTLDAFAELVQTAKDSPSADNLTRVIDTLVNECDHSGLFKWRKGSSSEIERAPWTQDLLRTPDLLRTVVDMADNLSATDVKTAWLFYYDQIMWPDAISLDVTDEDWQERQALRLETRLQIATRLLAYADLAVKQQELGIAAKIMDQFFHFQLHELYDADVQMDIQDKYGDILIAFIDADPQAAADELDDKRGISDPNDPDVAPLYRAMAYQAEKHRGRIRSAVVQP